MVGKGKAGSLAPARTPETLFAATYRDVLASWAARLEATTGPIIAIARKAPRVIELVVREGLASPTLLERMTTEHALVLGVRGGFTEFVICDDAIAFGSTFLRVAELLQASTPTSRVVGMPCVVGRETLLPSIRKFIPANVPTLSRDELQRFVADEVLAFGALDKPYDVDHPIVELRLRPGTAHDAVAGMLWRVARDIGAEFYATPRDVQRAEGAVPHHVWSLLIRVSDQLARRAQFTKLRVYLDESAAVLRLVPIAPTTATLIELTERVSTLGEGLQQAWRIGTRPSAVGDLAVRTPSLVVWANFLIELDALWPVMRRVCDRAERDGIASTDRMSISRLDLATLVGTNTTTCASEIDADLARTRPAPRTHRTVPTSSVLDDVVLMPRDPTDFRPLYEGFLRTHLPGAISREDVLECAFDAQHRVELATREVSSSSRRLDFGVGLPHLEDLVRQTLGSVDTVLLHRALDRVIDRGVAVPRYLPAGDVWFRSFRIGESRHKTRLYIGIDGFEMLSDALGTPQTRELVLEKYYVLTLQCMREDEALRPTFERAGLTSRPYLYGQRPALTGTSNDWYVEWLVQRRVLARHGEGRPRPGRTDVRYGLVPTTRDRYPENDTQLDGRTRKLLGDVAHWSAIAAKPRSGLGPDFLTAVTTVRSASAYEEALAAELYWWIEHGQEGLDAVVQMLRALARQDSDQLRASARLRLADFANWPAQAEKKILLRQLLFTGIPDADPRGARLSYVDRADRLWPARSSDPAATAWRMIVRPLVMNANAQERGERSTLLEYAARVAHRVSSLMRSVIDQFSPESDRGAQYRPIAENVTLLEAALRDHPEDHVVQRFAPAREILMELSTSRDQQTAARLGLLTVEHVADAVEWVLDLRSRPATPLVNLEHGLFVIAWDVRNGSSGDREPDEQYRNLITRVNERIRYEFAQDILHMARVEPTDADDNHVVVRRFDAAVEIGRAVAESYAPDYSVRVAIDTNLHGYLQRPADAARPITGSAFHFATRWRDLYKEIERAQDRKGTQGGMEVWRQPEMLADPREPAGSYCVVSGAAHDVASSLGSKLPRMITLEGQYRPRLAGALIWSPVRIFALDRPSGAPPTTQPTLFADA